jgi:methyl-accepting chemotaxis protein
VPLVEQAAAAAESMEEQANNLAQAVAIFKLHGIPESSVENRPVNLARLPKRDKTPISRPLARAKTGSTR